MQTLFKMLDNTMNQSGIVDFRKFLTKFADVEKWFMVSDYCFDDKNKSNNVISFVLCPYIVDFNTLIKYINEIQRTDLKHCRSVSKEFCEFAHSGVFFSFNYIIDKESYLTKWKDQATLERMIEDYIDMINDKWKRETPDKIEHYVYLEEKLKKLKNKMTEKNFNYKLLSRTVIVVFLASYIKYLLLKELNCVNVYSWLSDRDKITGCYDSIYEILYEIISHCLCANLLPEKKFQGVKELLPADIEKNLFYDELIRVPDFLCGGLAAQNLTTGEVDKQKHCTLIEDAIADNQNILIIDFRRNDVARIVHKRIKDV